MPCPRHALGADSRRWPHVGAPTNFGNSWYSSYRPTSYGYSGPSAWHMALPIFILSRPYGCGYHCHYHHHNRIHNEQERELEYLTLNLDCDMSMDLVMNGAFRPSDFQAPFTVNIDSVTANVGPVRSPSAPPFPTQPFSAHQALALWCSLCF